MVVFVVPKTFSNVISYDEQLTSGFKKIKRLRMIKTKWVFELVGRSGCLRYIFTQKR